MKVIAGCLLGLALGAAYCYGLTAFADWIVEQTHGYSISDRR